MLIPQRSDHTLIETGQDRNDNQQLQRCDVLIGGFRFHSCFSDRKHPRIDIGIQYKQLLDHEQENSAHMAQSRYCTASVFNKRGWQAVIGISALWSPPSRILQRSKSFYSPVLCHPSPATQSLH